MSAALAFFSGTLLSFMLQMNRALSAQYGAYRAAFYIHLIGAVFAACLLAASGSLCTAFRRVPRQLYLGGVCGVVTMLCNNLSYGHLSLTSIMALGIFAQLVLSLLIDRFSRRGQKLRRGETVLPLALSALGIVLLLDSTVRASALYVLLSLLAGASVIATRVFNAQLSARVGTLQSAFLNYLTALPLCFLLALAANEAQTAAPFRLFAWCGGLIGSTNVVLSNRLVPRMSASQLTMLTLCGQLLCGALLDVLCGSTLNTQEFFAGVLIAAGSVLSYGCAALGERKQNRDTADRARIARAEAAHRTYVLNRCQKRKNEER